MDREPLRSEAGGAPDHGGLVQVLEGLGPALPEYLRVQRWFGSKGRTLAAVTVVDSAPLSGAGVPCALALIEVGFTEGPAEIYLLPVAARPAAEAERLLERPALARFTRPDGTWVLYDALDDRAVCEALLRRVESADRLDATGGAFSFDRTPVLSQATGGARPIPVEDVRRVRSEQSNTSIIYDRRLVLKVFRKPAEGVNPELEVTRFLTLRTRFRNVPLLAGFAEYQGSDVSRTVAVLHTFVPNEGDAWTWTLACLRAYYAEAGTCGRPGAGGETVPLASGLAGGYLIGARRLGEVTGELHTALATDVGDPAFTPESVTRADIEAWGAAIETQLQGGLAGLRATRDRAGADLRPAVERVLAADDVVRVKVAELARFSSVALWKTRVHGDYHLGQVLRAAGGEGADDFVILDFEGEPARSPAARRAKQSPLRDVAGMLRSFTYASYAGLFEATAGRPESVSALEPWRAAWETVVIDAFLEGYLAVTVRRAVAFVPARREDLERLLGLFCLERAGYELYYELNNRPTWVKIPLATLERQLCA